jgi:hypothetical protein
LWLFACSDFTLSKQVRLTKFYTKYLSPNHVYVTRFTTGTPEQSGSFIFRLFLREVLVSSVLFLDELLSWYFSNKIRPPNCVH